MKLGPQGLLESRDPQAPPGLQDPQARMDKRGPLGHQVGGLRSLSSQGYRPSDIPL